MKRGSSDSSTSSSSKRTQSGNTKSSTKFNDKSTPDSNSSSSSGKNTRSPRKTSKLNQQSPTKKSQDHLTKLNLEKDAPDQGNQKFTRDISDVGASKLPAIVSHILISLNSFILFIYQPEAEIMEFMIPEDLSEVQRIKILLSKKNENQ
jgi:hypothetical protein